MSITSALRDGQVIRAAEAEFCAGLLLENVDQLLDALARYGAYLQGCTEAGDIAGACLAHNASAYAHELAGDLRAAAQHHAQHAAAAADLTGEGAAESYLMALLNLSRVQMLAGEHEEGVATLALAAQEAAALPDSGGAAAARERARQLIRGLQAAAIVSQAGAAVRAASSVGAGTAAVLVALHTPAAARGCTAPEVDGLEILGTSLAGRLSAPVAGDAPAGRALGEAATPRRAGGLPPLSAVRTRRVAEAASASLRADQLRMDGPTAPAPTAAAAGGSPRGPAALSTRRVAQACDALLEVDAAFEQGSAAEEEDAAAEAGLGSAAVSLRALQGRDPLLRPLQAW
jgi:hypothetical protein